MTRWVSRQKDGIWVWVFTLDRRFQVRHSIKLGLRALGKGFRDRKLKTLVKANGAPGSLSRQEQNNKHYKHTKTNYQTTETNILQLKRETS
jgi:hypothetical protein